MITMIKKDMTNKEKPQLESDIIRQKMLDEVLNENAKLAEKNAKLREEIAKLNDEKEKVDPFINLLFFTSALHKDEVNPILREIKPLYNDLILKNKM